MNNTLNTVYAPLGIEINNYYDSLDFLSALASIAHGLGLNPGNEDGADLHVYAMESFARLLQIGVDSMREEVKMMQGDREKENNVGSNGITSSVNNQEG